MNFNQPNNDPQNYYWWSEGFSREELIKIYSDLESIPFQKQQLLVLMMVIL